MLRENEAWLNDKLEEIRIIIDETDWQFISKEDDRSCEVINTKTKRQWEGFISRLSSTGAYTVELKEEIEGM